MLPETFLVERGRRTRLRAPDVRNLEYSGRCAFALRMAAHSQELTLGSCAFCRKPRQLSAMEIRVDKVHAVQQ